MAKVITQEMVDKQIAKAVKAETKRCLGHVKSTEVDSEVDNAAKAVRLHKAAAAAAIKAEQE